eukprot:scaffold24943_cov82-Cyclotella_meneghiniana.AAC.1
MSEQSPTLTGFEFEQVFYTVGIGHKDKYERYGMLLSRNGQLLANIGRDNNQYCQRRNNMNQLTCMGRCSKQTLESGQLTDCSKPYYCGISNRSVHMQPLRHEQGCDTI